MVSDGYFGHDSAFNSSRGVNETLNNQENRQKLSNVFKTIDYSVKEVQPFKDISEIREKNIQKLKVFNKRNKSVEEDIERINKELYSMLLKDENEPKEEKEGIAVEVDLEVDKFIHNVKSEEGLI